MTEKQDDLLIPNDEYLKAGIHIGTKFKTKYMENFIYKTRQDGLNVLNIESIDSRLKVLAQFLANYEPQDILILSRRENGWKPTKKFAEITGAQVLTGRYPPGILTNSNLKIFTEAKVMVVSDPWPDRNAVKDALKMGIVVAAFCDTNNQSNNIDLVVPCNNKGKKSLALAFFLLAREYMKNKKQIKSDKDFKYTLEDFGDE